MTILLVPRQCDKLSKNEQRSSSVKNYRRLRLVERVERLSNRCENFGVGYVLYHV